MAQLSDDCFAFGGKLLTVAEARMLIASGATPVAGTERVGLLEADGRVLAEGLAAPGDLPPFRNSAVDGYAVRLADLDAGRAMPVVGRLPAGAAPSEALEPGTARRIFTGAAMPPGADTVFMQEDVELSPAGVRLPAGLKPGANTRPQGEDILAGASALPPGVRLRPQDLALAAALGVTHLAVRRRVRVGLFSTGSELVGPGDGLGPAQQHDSNRVLLGALARRSGAEVSDLGILPDDPGAIRAALAAAGAGHDLVLTSGGVSAGEEDWVRDAVQAVGSLAFWRLAIKPGRPVAMGQVGTAAFMGLPGNPVAAFVTFTMVARPLLAALAGEAWAPAPGYPVVAGFSYRKKTGRREYVRVRVQAGPDGVLHARKHPVDGAGILTSLTMTDGLVELGEDAVAVTPGEVVAYVPYGGGLF